MSYNIRLSTDKDGTNAWKYRCPATLEMIKNQNPDVFGVQEALPEQVSFLEEWVEGYDCVGVALKSLFTQYKADGKLDMGNLNNLMNLAALATNVQGLKGQTDKTTFYKDFASGLVLGSNNLVNSANSTSIMSGLQNLVNNVDLSGLTQKAETTKENLTEKLTAASSKANTAVENATEIAGAVTNILNLFKK